MRYTPLYAPANTIAIYSKNTTYKKIKNHFILYFFAMKKFFIIPLVLATIVMAGCTNKQAIEETSELPNTANFSLLQNQTTKYPYTWKMTKPEISEMNNRNALQNGFHDTWKISYQVPEFDISDPMYKQFCLTSGFDIINADNEKILKNIPFKEFISGAKFDVSDQYNGNGLWLTFSEGQKNFLAQHGRMIFKANSWFLEEMKSLTYYEWEGTNPDDWGDEWATNYNKIAWVSLPYKRYPYNTILVTSDLLLHVYHRVFSNSLKYYEETIARPMVADLSASLFEKFLALSKQTSDAQLKKNYELLAAYRSIPYSILIPNNELIDKITTNANTNSDPENSADLSNEQLQKLIIERQKWLLSKLWNNYQQAVQDTLNEILQATNAEGNNILLETFSSNMMDNFWWFNALKFDYTQFKPRAHYTTDSLLKTYFMAMKWLMREKLFFADKNIAAAWLIMVNNIKNEDLSQFNTFYTFIQKLIGEDDDVNITDIQKFIADQKRSSDSAIIQWINDDIQKKLMVLRPQRIMSVSYTTPGIGDVTEQKAKDMTAGFIFFGEKFTIDSWFFDQFTAGSAEKEGEYKPRVQSALMVTDNLLNIPVTQKFAQLWLEKNKTQFEISPEQIAGYNKIKSNVAQNKILTTFNFGTTVYHTRLNMLATLFISGGNNAPYFMEDALYQNKLLNTYLGSYTELKHDTLLYVKQAYAEMGGGGDGPCSRSIEPPELPIPKWYVEPNIDLIDGLIALTQETTTFFSGAQYQQFLDYLIFIKKIALAQTTNQKIDDADFETLRTSAQTLTTITTPQKLFGQPLQKEKRWAIIADIFTSGKYGPLYEAVGRPYMMMMMVNDSNGARIVVGPIFSHYEFYADQAPFEAVGGGRFTDEDWQNNYDGLTWITEINSMSLPLTEIIQTIEKQ